MRLFKIKHAECFNSSIYLSCHIPQFRMRRFDEGKSTKNSFKHHMYGRQESVSKPLKTWTATGRQMQSLLVRFFLKQSVGKPSF